MRTIIGLAGVKTSGKSTVANMIKEFVPNAKEAALADKLKDTCSEVFDISREYFDRQELKEVPFKDGAKKLTNGAIGAILESFGVYMSRREIDSIYNVVNMKLPTPRKIAQIIGTEVLRAAGDEDIHCKNVKLNENGVTIISDLRFPNEFKYFNEKSNVKFIPLYIQRDEAEQYVTEDSHPSEKCVFEFNDKCIKIDNNGNLRDTERQIKNIIDREIYGYGTSK